MRINNNLMAMNTHRQLGIVTNSGAKSTEKLSSGFRINRAGDDAAGLAISEKMRGQIRGLNMASKNAQDGISLIQTAEGALNETHAILQRMRELAVQAASDTNVKADRDEIQKEINQLTSEINRIGNTTEFNTMQLINGERAITPGKEFVAGMSGDYKVSYTPGLTISGSQEDEWLAAIEEIKVKKEDSASGDKIDWSGVNTSGNDSNSVKISKTTTGDLKIDISAKVTTDVSGVSTYSLTLDAETLALGAEDGIYQVDFHGVSFDLDVEAFKEITASSIDLNLKKAKDGASGASIDVQGDYGLKNDFETGAATFEDNLIKIDENAKELAGLETIQIEYASGSGTITVTGKDASGKEIIKDKKVLDTALASGNTYKYDEAGIEFKITLKTTGSTPSTVSFKTNEINVKDLAGQIVGDNLEGIDKSLAFQVGANQDQAMSLDINDMRSEALGISSRDAGKGFAEGKAVTDGTNNIAEEFALDVSSHKAAAASVTTINNAIETVSAERSKLGAIQNRLEHTIKNLDTSAENLQASEARIRDVDMAKEMMEFTKNNILQQASTAMLAQANMAPQTVLQLLR